VRKILQVGMGRVENVAMAWAQNAIAVGFVAQSSPRWRRHS